MTGQVSQRSRTTEAAARTNAAAAISRTSTMVTNNGNNNVEQTHLEQQRSSRLTTTGAGLAVSKSCNSTSHLSVSGAFKNNSNSVRHQTTATAY